MKTAYAWTVGGANPSKLEMEHHPVLSHPGLKQMTRCATEPTKAADSHTGAFQPEPARMTPPGGPFAETTEVSCPEPSAGMPVDGARDFLGQRLVYSVVSPRARGLSVGINLNPDAACNFDCVYCEVNRSKPRHGRRFDTTVMAAELAQTLELVHSGRLRERPGYRNLPEDLMQLRHVALSGEGEPTLCPQFSEAVDRLIHLRTCGRLPWFRLVLITNASRLDQPAVVAGLSQFTARDEVWAKLEAGTDAYALRINRPDCTLERIVANILQLARQRPVIVQSLFPIFRNEAPPEAEISAYLQRLLELKEGGAQIPLVQIYSATRPSAHSECAHLSLRALSQIARRVRDVTGLVAEVF